MPRCLDRPCKGAPHGAWTASINAAFRSIRNTVTPRTPQTFTHTYWIPGFGQPTLNSADELQMIITRPPTASPIRIAPGTARVSQGLSVRARGAWLRTSGFTASKFRRAPDTVLYRI